MIVNRDLIWDKWNRNHIKKHKVSVEEVYSSYAGLQLIELQQQLRGVYTRTISSVSGIEEVYRLSELTTRAKSGRTLVISKIKNGRMITIFLSIEKQTKPYVVSARDASKAERRQYYEKN